MVVQRTAGQPALNGDDIALDFQGLENHRDGKGNPAGAAAKLGKEGGAAVYVAEICTGAIDPGYPFTIESINLCFTAVAQKGIGADSQGPLYPAQSSLIECFHILSSGVAA